jgi:exportin-2 (importin alpha re-exporter)
MLGRVG